MRKIEFPPGTRPSTKIRVGTLAWATNRRGRNPWRSANVTTTIAEYINAAGYAFNSADVSMAIKWLCDNKYAVRRKQEGKKRTLEFTFLPDVDLTGFLPEGPKLNGTVADVDKSTSRPFRAIGEPRPGVTRLKESAGAMANKMHDQGVDKLNSLKEGTAGVDAVLDIDVPIPGAPEHPPVFRLDELCEVLTRWSDRDQDAYARWVERALETLHGVLG